MADLHALADRYYIADGTRKDSLYLDAYHLHFSGRCQEPLHILELGVASGASLMLWQEYFPRAKVAGLDLKPRPALLEEHKNIYYAQGSQDDTALLDKTARKVTGGSGFDIIIDDASHVGYLSHRSFDHLFRKWLKPGGWYVIEDFGTGLMTSFPDGAEYHAPPAIDATTTTFPSHDHGMVGWVKQLGDHQLLRYAFNNDDRFYPIKRMDVHPHICFVQRL